MKPILRESIAIIIGAPLAVAAGIVNTVDKVAKIVLSPLPLLIKSPARFVLGSLSSALTLADTLFTAWIVQSRNAEEGMSFEDCKSSYNKTSERAKEDFMGSMRSLSRHVSIPYRNAPYYLRQGKVREAFTSNIFTSMYAG